MDTRRAMSLARSRAGDVAGRVGDAFDRARRRARSVTPSLDLDLELDRSARNALLVGGGIAAGAILLYLLEPREGRARRAALRDRAASAGSEAADALGGTLQHGANRARGMGARVKSLAFWRHRDESDEKLEARVRSRLGRLVSHPRAIDVTAHEGTVTLHGPVLREEVGRLLARVWTIKGVDHVENQLEVHDTQDHPSLQGQGRQQNAPFEEHWPPSLRAAAGLGGGALVIYALRSRSLLGGVLGAVGAGLVVRALLDTPLSRAAGVSRGTRPIDVHRSIRIEAPVDEVYGFWEHLENWPRFMSHLKDVRRTDDERSHWVASGPLGVSVEWDARVVERQPNRLIAWRSEPGSDIGTSGSVRFHRVSERATQIDVVLHYVPPAGSLGHLVASAFGDDPARAMDDDLARLKQLLEENRAARGA